MAYKNNEQAQFKLKLSLQNSANRKAEKLNYGQIYIKKEDRFLEQYIYKYIDDLDIALSYRTDKLLNGDIVYIFTGLDEYNESYYVGLKYSLVLWEQLHKEKEESIIKEAKDILDG